MSDFIIEILQNNSTIDIESSILNNLELNQNNVILENETTNIIVHTLEIERSETSTIEINTDYVGTVVFAGDVIGLDNFIANFIDNYEIDCGSP